VLLNNGDGTFQPAVNYLPSGAGVLFVANTVDLNSDGVPDLVAITADESANVAVLLGNGDGTFQSAPGYAVAQNPNSIAMADFNGDGIPDLVVANNGSGNISVLLGNANGSYQPAVNYPNAASGGVGNIVAADFNGDGIPDIAVASAYPNGIFLFLGNGDGTFQPSVAVPVSYGANYIAAGDFNGDGKADLAVLTLLGGVVLLGKGDGTFQTGASLTLDPGTILATIVAADLNGDGKLDLVVSNGGSNNDVEVLLGNGDGTFQSNIGAIAGPGVQSVTVGDFNGDGKPDLAVAIFGCSDCSNGAMGSMMILLGDGDGTFQPALSYPAVPGPLFAAVADFNGDGFADLAVTSGLVEPHTVALLLGNGDGTFQLPQMFGAGFPGSLVVADLNGDAKPDIAVADATANKVSVLLNSCPAN
jgi:hypothetical protein